MDRSNVFLAPFIGRIENDERLRAANSDPCSAPLNGKPGGLYAAHDGIIAGEAGRRGGSAAGAPSRSHDRDRADHAGIGVIAARPAVRDPRLLEQKNHLQGMDTRMQAARGLALSGRHDRA